MKIAAFIAFAALIPFASLAQQKPALVMAINDDRSALASSPWNVETGEIYKFVRYMGHAEFMDLVDPTHEHRGRRPLNEPPEVAPSVGGQAALHPEAVAMGIEIRRNKIHEAASLSSPAPSDRSYIVLSVGDVVVISPTENFAPVDEKGYSDALGAYVREIQAEKLAQEQRASRALQKEQNKTLQEINRNLRELNELEQFHRLQGR